MSAYDLPTSLTIGGVGYPIRSNWRAIIDILIACNDPDLDDQAQTMVMLQILYPDWRKIPPQHVEEAIRKGVEFIDCGHKEDSKPKPKMIDWEQDSSIIIPEVNKVASLEIRQNPGIHWWTFLGWFMGIGDGLLANVLHIRQKRQKGQKLEKWEETYYRENKELIDFRKTEEEKSALEYFSKWL